MDNSSSSTSASTTTNLQQTAYTYTDARQAIDNRDSSIHDSGNTSTSVSNSGNTFSGIGTGVGNNTSLTDSFNTNSHNVTNVTTTDQGAVAAGKAVAIAGMQQNSTNYDSLLGVADTLFAQTKKTTDANLQLAGQLASGAGAAFSDATSQATGNKTILYVALAAVVCVVGLAMLKR